MTWPGTVSIIVRNPPEATLRDHRSSRNDAPIDTRLITQVPGAPVNVNVGESEPPTYAIVVDVSPATFDVRDTGRPVRSYPNDTVVAPTVVDVCRFTFQQSP